MTRAIERIGVELDSSGGFHFDSNCPVCGGGWVVEGASKGRDDIPKCTTVIQAVYCRDCQLQMVLEVRLAVVTQARKGARL